MSHFGGWRQGKGASRTRHDAGRMNNTESAYASHLGLLQLAGEVAAFDFEPLKLRLADKTYYTIDFLVQLPDGSLEAHEVKGHMEDDAAVKVKVAQEKAPWLRFFIIRKEGPGIWRKTPIWKEDRYAKE